MNLPNSPSRGLKSGPHYWREIQRAGAAGFTTRSLWGRTSGVGRAAVYQYVRRLRTLGLVKQVGIEPRPAGQKPAPIYAATTTSQRSPAVHEHGFTGRGGRQQAQLWAAMRALSQWMLGEIAVVASTDECEVTANSASYYTRSLLRAGLVQVIRPFRLGSGGPQPAVYRLKVSANSGPKPLRIVRGRGVYDPNRNAWVANTDADEVSA